MLLSKKSTRNLPVAYRCVSEAAASFTRDYNISDIARQMGKSATTLSNKLNQNVDSHMLGLIEAEAIQLITQDFRILNAMALHAGKVLFDLPDANLTREELTVLNLSLMESQGELAKSMRVALEHNHITETDFTIIEKTALESITSTLQIVAELREMVGRKIPGRAESLKVAS